MTDIPYVQHFLSKYLTIFAAVLFVVVCAFGYGWYKTGQSLRATNVLLTEQKATSEALKARVELTQLLVTKETNRANENRRALRKALADNAAWAAGRIPDSVRDSLCIKPAKCSDRPAAVQ